MKDETETRPIPIDGALEHLREVAEKATPYGASLTYAASLHAAVEVLAEAISRAQDAEKARYPLRVVSADPSIEARAKTARDAYFEHGTGETGWEAVVRAVDASREVPAQPPLTPAEEVLADLLAIDVHGPANFGDAVIEVMVRHDWRGGRRPNERAAALLRRAGKRP